MGENTVLITAVCILAVLSLVTLFVASSNENVDQDALVSTITAQVVSKIPEQQPVPTAAEIAALIPKQETPIVNIPESTENAKVDDVWKQIYADQIEALETEAYNVAELELEDHDYKELTNWLEDKIVGFDELENVDIRDYEITVVNLGLDDDEDKVATVDFELKVKYSLLEGSDDTLKKTVHAIATVTFDEGDFTDEDVELVFN